MSDQRFLELLNLYLDHELSDAEAVELDTAVRSHPERRRTYDDYCRLQRGCSLISSGASLAAPAAPRYIRSLHEVERKIAHPRTSPALSPVYMGAFASLALAMGIAWVVVTQRPASSPSLTGAAVDQLASSERSVILASATTYSPSVGRHATFAAPSSVMALALGVNENAPEFEIAATDREALAWMQRVDQLPRESLSIDEQAFTGNAMPPPDTRVFRRHSPQPSAVEFTGFQFQR